MRKLKATSLLKEHFLVTIYAVLALILMLMISTRGEAQAFQWPMTQSQTQAVNEELNEKGLTDQQRTVLAENAQEALNACQQARDHAAKWCGAVNPMTPMLAQLLGSLIHGQGDTVKQQCEKAVTAERYGIATTAITFERCGNANKQCQSACRETIRSVESQIEARKSTYGLMAERRVIQEAQEARDRHCVRSDMQQLALLTSGMQLMNNIRQSGQCAAMSDGDGEDPDRVVGVCEENPNTEECRCKFYRENGIPAPAYCGDGGDGDQGPDYKNQFAGGGNPLGDPDFSGLDGYGDEINDPYSGNDLGDGGAAGLAGDQSGGGAYTPNAGGAGGGAGGGEGNKGPGKGPYDVDVLRGTTSGQGGGGYAAGGGGGGNRGGGYGGGRTDDDKMKFDLSKYLPGQKKAQKRSIAQIESQTTVSAANGMTNFEKISRRMNQQRARLLP